MAGSVPEIGHHPLRLDRSKYHSTVHGEFQSATQYWQDGLPFDAAEHLVLEECDAAMRAKADAKAPKRPPPADPLSESARLAAAQDHTERGTNQLPITEGDVNLELWAKGDARYPPFKVFIAIRERYNKSVSTFADAIEFLVNEAKLVTKQQASEKLLGMGGGARAPEEA